MKKFYKFKVGDKVLITKAAKDGENQWETYWTSNMDCTIGKVFTIRREWCYREDKKTNSYYLDGEFSEPLARNCVFPDFVFKLIKNKKEPKWKNCWRES